MFLLLFLVFLFISTILPQNCNLCSDTNIETISSAQGYGHPFRNVLSRDGSFLTFIDVYQQHYGTFFTNPREVQIGFTGDVDNCVHRYPAIHRCDSACFVLNVTYWNSKERKVSVFGSSYGCSTEVLPETSDESYNSCYTKNVTLRTYPPYQVLAEYCLCLGTRCNSLRTSKPKINRSRIPHNYDYMCNFHVTVLIILLLFEL